MKSGDAQGQGPENAVEVVEALRVILQAVTPEREAGLTYYDQHTSPLGEHAYKSAIRAGAFPAFRVGKRLLARREVVDSWIESEAHRVNREPRLEVRDEIDEVLAAGGIGRGR
jgi:hypothetical protein